MFARILSAIAAVMLAAAPAAAAQDVRLPAPGPQGPLAATASEIAPVLVAPWGQAPADAYVVRYFPGVTFRQGQAPVYMSASQRPAGFGFEAPALGVGLEGRSPAGHGWQLLANYSSSPLAVAPDPRLVLHGFWLPQHTWGLDADVGLDPRGTLGAELGTVLLLPDSRLRLAGGRQEGGGQPGYGWGQATLGRDFPGFGTSAGLTLFAGQDGAGLGGADLWHSWLPTPSLRLATTGSLGIGDARLPIGRRLGVGLISAGGATADARGACRGEVAVPLARGLAWGWKPLATLAQVEGAAFVEGGYAYGASDRRDGVRAGAGCELGFALDTGLGMPLGLGVGVAVPVGGPPVVYLTTAGVRFSR